MKQARPQKETKTNFLAHGSLLSSDWLSGSFWHASATKNQQCISSQPGQNQFLMEDSRERETEAGERREAKQREKELL